VSLGAAQLLAGLLLGLGLLSLGLYVGLGVREDREADRHARIALARITAREAARPPVLYLFPAPAAEAPPFYRPGYAEAFPRPGRFTVEHPGPGLPHGPAFRPITSPVDLDGAVRLMCIETELYVAALIAGTHHAERNGTNDR
jgi:hypothetical protein